MHPEFMAFLTELQTLQLVRSWADKQGFPGDAVREGGPDLFSVLLEAEAPPKLALVDFDTVEQPVQVAARLVSLCGPATRIIAVGTANDVGLYRSIIAAGLNDYLVKPLTPEVLTQTMMAAARGDAPGAPKNAKDIVVIGVRGGVGASTIAANLAWLIAHERKEKCALLDLDLQYGSSALSLDIEPGHGLRDVVSSPQRVDSLMIAGAQVSESDNLVILSAEEPIDEVIHVDPHAISALIKEMRTGYRAILVDMPRHMIATQKRLLATAHEIILVTEMSLIGIRDTLRMRTTIKGLGSSARITQIATKIGTNRPAAVDEATFTKGAQAKIDFVFPDEHKNLVLASNAGKMLGAIAPDAAANKVLRQLAAHLLDELKDKDGVSKKQNGLLSSLFKGSEKGAPKS